MISKADVLKLLTEQIIDVETQWSAGTFGGIAEFSRDPGEAARLTTSEKGVAAVTARGGVAITLRDDIRPFASESITKQSWSHRVALCLPEAACAMSRRNVLTELGPDAEALRDEDRAGVLFDLGLEALQADLCLRFSDHDVVSTLREHVGRSVFEYGNPAMGIILNASPHRVFVSHVGRVEVFQSIPPATGKSPDGPHTHVLPKLLKSRRTHPATEPVPEGLVPCAYFYPAHPAKDAMGDPRPFDHARHAAFQGLIERLGLPQAIAIKQRVAAAVTNEEGPDAVVAQSDRLARTNVRVSLRQLKAVGHRSRTLPDWLAAFDRAADEGDEDEAEKQHAQ
jgi:hypothetical protein